MAAVAPPLAMIIILIVLYYVTKWSVYRKK